MSESEQEQNQSQDDWKELMEKMPKDVLLSSPRVRQEFLKVVLPAHMAASAIGSEVSEEVLSNLEKTLSLYDDRKSRLAVENSLNSFLNNTTTLQFFIEFFISTSKHLCVQGKEGNFASTDGVRYGLFRWSLILMSKISKSEILESFFNSQLILLDSMANSHYFETSKKKLSISLKKSLDVVEAYKQILQKKELTLSHSTVLGVIYDVLHSKKMVSDSDRAFFVSFYVKVVLPSKTPVPDSTLRNITFVPLISQDDLKTQISPALDKMMLRSPEVVFPAAIHFFKNSSVDLSGFFKDVYLKSLSNNLKSTNAELRGMAIGSSKDLFKQCGDEANVTHVVNELIAILNGSQGKLTSWEHKVSFLQSLQSASLSPLTASAMEKLGALVIEKLFAASEKETHEITHFTYLDAITAFLPKVSSLTPYIKYFQTGLKSEKTSFRRGYITCLINGTKGESVKQLTPLLDLIIASYTKSQSQSLAQPNMFAEACLAIQLVIHMKSINSQIDQDLTKKNFWKDILNVNSFLFNEKIYSKMPQDDSPIYVSLLDSMIRKLNMDVDAQIHRKILDGLIHHSISMPWKQGKIAKDCIKGLVKDYPEVRKHAVESYLGVLSSQAKLEKIQHKSFVATYMAISSFPQSTLTQEDKELLIQLFLPSFHPYLNETNITQTWWFTSLKRSGLNPSEFVKEKSETIATTLYGLSEAAGNNTLLSTAFKKALMFLSVASTEIESLLLAKTITSLNSNEILEFTNDEIGIFRTPEGEMYDNVLDKKKSEKTSNVKKASNAYSYEDQIWDEQVKKEIAQKKKTLTKEEEKLVKEQLAKEAEVRKKVSDVYKRVVSNFEIIFAFIEGNNNSMHGYIPKLLKEVVYPLVASPLVGSLSYQLAMKLGKCVTPKLQLLAPAIMASAFRMMNVPFVEENWKSSKVNENSSRILNQLFFFVENYGPLPPPSFAYVFRFVREVLFLPKQSDESIDKACELTKLHCSLGGSPLLPRADMIRIFIHVIKKGGLRQKVAQEAIVNLSENIDDTASDEEISLLLDCLISPLSFLRFVGIQCLFSIPASESTAVDFASRLWLCCHDDEEMVLNISKSLWEDTGSTIGPGYWNFLKEYLISPHKPVRNACGRAIKSAMGLHPKTAPETFTSILRLYEVKAKLPEPEYDELGRLVKSDFVDEWEIRVSIADSLKEYVEYLTEEDMPDFVKFVVYVGLADHKDEPRAKILNSATEILQIHGKKCVQKLLPILENYLSQPSPATETGDKTRGSVVILTAELAKFLDPSDPKVPLIVQKLLDTLKIPSEQVQKAVSQCLPPLVKSLKEETPALIKQMLDLTLNSKKYGERRGGAFGLAGIVKGRGIGSLKECNVMGVLKEAIEDKTNSYKRQGALFAFETLSMALGILFEAYVIQILPLLLTSYGDNSLEVRDATSEAARSIMSKISGPGVKLILPSILEGLSDKSWRTKQGSAELLGSMAYLAPKQLSACLPSIVPKLVETLNDSHPKVVESGKQALQQIGSVIKNPEIQAIVPVILGSIVDPSKTSTALNSLLLTAFVHVIDPASLALIVPVLQRGLKDRSTETKKMSAQIMGNMSSLTEEKDLSPYLQILLPGLKGCLIDPIPEVRKTSAMALGTMVKKLGENTFEGLIPWLLSMLKSESSTVDRMGAAQGLAEVLGGLGTNKLDALLPDIIANCNSALPHVREGYTSVLIYLPSTFGPKFQDYLSQVVQPILSGLADESEYVRESALRAGQMIATHFSSSSIELMLPELERGLFDDNWRIRQSSVQLLGDLLYKIVGVTGKTQTEGDDDDTIGTEEGKKALLEILGQERRDRVLASLYILRSDVNLLVRQSSVHVWKIIVNNTPKTMREVLTPMMKIILECLSSQSYDKRQVAGRTLGDLVKKLGDRVMPEIVPVLEEGLSSNKSHIKQGVCVGLTEVMQSAGRSQVFSYSNTLIAAIRKALCDEDEEVRESAGSAFDILYKQVGKPALDSILPSLLSDLSGQDELKSKISLEALKQITSVRSAVVFPALMEQLLNPFNTSNAKALGAILPFSGNSLTRYLPAIISGLMESFNSLRQKASPIEEVTETTIALLSSIQGDEMVRHLMTELTEKSKADLPYLRRETCNFIGIFCQNSSANYSLYLPNLFRITLNLMDDPDENTVVTALTAFEAIVGSIKKDELPQHAIHVRRVLNQIQGGLKGKSEIKGLTLPKSATPLMQLFTVGLQNGTPEIKEQSALGIGDVISMSAPVAVEAKTIGPLIKIAGDRFQWQIKAAVLGSLSLAVFKLGNDIKAFVSQLQITFVKALSDGNEVVRQKAAEGLSNLVPLQPKVDPLIVELNSGIKNNDNEIKIVYLNSLLSTLKDSGNKIGEVQKKNVSTTLSSLVSSENDAIRSSSAKCIAYIILSSPSESESITAIKNLLSEIDASSPWTTRHSVTISLSIILKEKSELITNSDLLETVANLLIKHATDEKVQIVEMAAISIGDLLLGNSSQIESHVSRLVSCLGQIILEKPFDGKKASINSIKTVAKKKQEILSPYLLSFVPALINCVKDKNIPLKLGSERALIYALRLKDGEEVLEDYTKKIDANAAKTLVDYYKRVLQSKTSEDSEEEKE